MKKFFALLLIAGMFSTLTIGLTGCGDAKKAPEVKKDADKKDDKKPEATDKK